MLLLEKVFQIINESGLEYCIQNKYEMMPEEIPSDIDMMYKDASEEFLDKLVQKIAKETDLLVTQKICQGYFEFTYILSYPVPKKFFQLQLDFYRAISRRGYLNIMPAEHMLENRRFYKCFYVPGYFDELRYMWIRRTIKKDLDQGHIEIARNLLNIDKDSHTKGLLNVFGSDVTKLILEIIDRNETKVFYDNFDKFNYVAKKISRKNCSIITRLNYAKFMCFTVIPKRVFHKCGISIAFLSPDGGGKTTIIERIRDTAGGSFYGDQVLYMRPRLLKNLGHYNAINPNEEAKTNTDPHGKTVNGRLKSLIRYLFYNFDFQIGTLVKVNKYKTNKQLVIFDRYYYDYYADMRRYQYNLPVWLPKALQWTIPSPNLVFILDADAECLYRRKQELDVSEISRQLAIYRNIANNMDNAYLIDVDRPVEEIVEDITENILTYCAERTRKIMK